MAGQGTDFATVLTKSNWLFQNRDTASFSLLHFGESWRKEKDGGCS